ncbi:uncharacterized protein F4822DRAFT_187592 [Hypoxylon trugodes]|uniref:uncharacterized protein n=1 Tax=Hypoxylon trugodes TaxID=326681 RepID=UPI00218E1399|nr:uncharacterized protein F4822DRAFT_187592 [Hypoxylon trugodes]KAI1391501.1 hypothetical protein F4822DRAFT_187592 [Hypoxylon trugodes]
MSLEQSRLPNGLDNNQRPIASRKPGKDSREQVRLSIASYTTAAEQLPDDVFTDMDAMEGTAVMDAREVTIEAPKLPERSALRASRFIESLKLDTIEPPTTDPHDAYLSSEEDASSSSNDFSDYEGDYDSDSDISEESPVRRASKEVTARAVSVIFIGRPCVVDLASGRRSVSPVRGPRSRASTTSSSRTDSFDSTASHPPRKSSLASTVDLPKENPSFLSQDPFASGNYKLESVSKEAASADANPRVPKTPTKAFHRFQKSLSLVRKRSRPNLKDASYRDSMSWSPSTTDLSSSSPDMSRASEEQQEQPQRPQQPTRSETEPTVAPVTPPQTPVTYNDIMKRAHRESAPRLLTKQPPAQPVSPSPISGKRGLLSGLNMNRRRSMRIKP